MNWSETGSRIIVGVVSAMALGVLAIVGNWASHGGLITLLGGISKTELEAKLKELPPSAPGGIPFGAVVAFDSDACPPGWTTFKPATARTIIGSGSLFEPGMEEDGSGVALKVQKYRGHGGARWVTLKEENLPVHQHDTQIASENSLFGLGETKPNAIFGSKYDRATVAKTSPYGKAKPDAVETLSPYVALAYCKKGL